ncbi:hypothetical protein VTK26DRAFT_1440 [Humicola hyalothermophila]
MVRLSYWIAPIFASLVWLATLFALLLYWIIYEDRVHYTSMSDNQQIAYISDIGASTLKPLFIAGCVLTTVLLDFSFLADRWLRHKGRLAPNTTTGEKVLSGLTIVFAIIGTVGLICLSVFDTARHPRLHNLFLLLFILGYVFSAIFICWEYWKLGKRHRERRILRISFYIKLLFVLIEVILAIAFASLNATGRPNQGAVLEWVIAFIFSAYAFSFFVDLLPAARTKQQLEVSGNGKGGLSIRLTRGRGARPPRGEGSGYPGPGEMEQAGSDASLTVPDGGASPEAVRASQGRRSHSRSRATASNF